MREFGSLRAQPAPAGSSAGRSGGRARLLRGSAPIVVSFLLLPLMTVASGAREGWEAGTPGQPLYQRYCADCHGATARGDGVRVARSKRPPPDLTRLGQRYGMPLPKTRLLATVLDPRRPGGARICGGPAFRAQPPAPHLAVLERGIVLEVLSFLETVQEVPQESSPGLR